MMRAIIWVLMKLAAYVAYWSHGGPPLEVDIGQLGHM